MSIWGSKQYGGWYGGSGLVMSVLMENVWETPLSTTDNLLHDTSNVH